MHTYAIPSCAPWLTYTVNVLTSHVVVESPGECGTSVRVVHGGTGFQAERFNSACGAHAGSEFTEHLGKLRKCLVVPCCLVGPCAVPIPSKKLMLLRPCSKIGCLACSWWCCCSFRRWEMRWEPYNPIITHGTDDFGWDVPGCLEHSHRRSPTSQVPKKDAERLKAPRLDFHQTAVSWFTW